MTLLFRLSRRGETLYFLFRRDKCKGLRPSCSPVLRFGEREGAGPRASFLLAMAVGVMLVAPAIASDRGYSRPAASERRVALVIGNGAYQNAPPLRNPVSDAKLISDVLKEAGFELIGGGPLIDADKSDLEKGIRAFGKSLRGGAVGLFYYSGHGVQVKGANYLIPVAANITAESDVKYDLVDSGFVLDEMANAGNRLNIVILDACRNNPFGGRGLRSASSGLAQVSAPAGTVISYATQPGNVAGDGAGNNSPYTDALAAAIRRPGLDVFATFNAVGLQVKQTTGGQQQPWLSTSPIEGQFYFSGLPGDNSDQTPPQQTASIPSKSEDGSMAVERAFWDSMSGSNDPEDFQDYLTRYPSGQFSGIAGRKLAALKKPTAPAPPPPPVASDGGQPLPALPEEATTGSSLLESWRGGFINQGGFLRRSR